jgi:hypothetical protein
MLKMETVKVRTRLIASGEGSVASELTNDPFGFHKRRGTFWLTKTSSYSKGNCSTAWR